MFSRIHNFLFRTLVIVVSVAVATPAVWLFLPVPQAQAAFSSCAAAYGSAFGITATNQTAAAPLGVPVAVNGQFTSQAVTAGNGYSNFFSDCIEHPLALSIGRLLLDQMTASIVNYINSGFQGSPSFVTNPQQFFENIGDQVAGNYIAGLVQGATGLNLCSPFQVQVQTALLANFGYSVNIGGGGGGDIYYSQPQSCSLSQIVGNSENALSSAYSQFTSWQAFLAISLNDDSNPYGAYLDAENQLESEINSQQGTNASLLNWGNGFLSQETCTTANGTTYIKQGGNGQSGSVTNVTSGAVISGGTPVGAGSELNATPGNDTAITLNNENNPNNSVDTSGLAAAGDALSNDDDNFNPDASHNTLQTFSNDNSLVSQTTSGTQSSISSNSLNSGVPAESINDNCQITTPGSTIAGVLQTQLGIPADQLGVASDLDEIFNSLFVQLIKQGIGAIGLGPGGLVGASAGTSYGGTNLLNSLQAQAQTGETQEQADAEAEAAQSQSQLQQAAQQNSVSGAQNDIALGKTVTATPGTSQQNSANLLVDGDTQQTDTQGVSQNFIGAITSNNPDGTGNSNVPGSFTIDLGQPTKNIYKIVVYPRNPSDAQSYDDDWYGSTSFSGKSYSQTAGQPPVFKVEVLDQNNTSVWDSQAQGLSPFSTFGTSPYTITLNPTTSGRYVVIQGLTNGALQLAEVQVYQDTGPTISLNGDSSIVVSAGQTLASVDQGATATDITGAALNVTPTYTDQNGNQINSGTEIVSGTTYTITYTAIDSLGVSNIATRTVVGQ